MRIHWDRRFRPAVERTASRKSIVCAFPYQFLQVQRTCLTSWVKRNLLTLARGRSYLPWRSPGRHRRLGTTASDHKRKLSSSLLQLTDVRWRSTSMHIQNPLLKSGSHPKTSFPTFNCPPPTSHNPVMPQRLIPPPVPFFGVNGQGTPDLSIRSSGIQS